MAALNNVNNMDNATAFSLATYTKTMDDMINDTMHWGDDFDQQQKYIDVYALYLGIDDETTSIADAITELQSIKDTQLLPWLEEDLLTLQDQWGLAEEVLRVPEPGAGYQSIAALLTLAFARGYRRRN